jgi:hypothetical protein
VGRGRDDELPTGAALPGPTGLGIGASGRVGAGASGLGVLVALGALVAVGVLVGNATTGVAVGARLGAVVGVGIRGAVVGFGDGLAVAVGRGVGDAGTDVGGVSSSSSARARCVNAGAAKKSIAHRLAASTMRPELVAGSADRRGRTYQVMGRRAPL